MNRKIVLLGPLPPPYGGVAIFTSALFEFTAELGVELWAAGESLPSQPNVRAIRYRKLGLIPLLLQRGARARIIDSFHFLIEHPNALFVPLWLLLKWLLRFEWIKVVHDGSLPARYQNFGPIRSRVFRLSLNAVDEFATVNDDIREFLQDVIGVRRPIRTMNALLPLPDSELNSALSGELSMTLDHYDRVVVSTGLFIDDYGFAHAAEAVERVRHEIGKNIGLVLVDGGYMRDETYRSQVLKERPWILTLEKLPHPLVLQVFRSSDVFIRGFRYEGYGLSRIEAIWCGIPVIAAMGEESRGMFLYEFGDVDKLTAQLRELLLNPHPAQVKHWSGVFQRQAEENLEGWKRFIGLSFTE